MPNTTRYFEAQQIWAWLQWRLTPAMWMEAQRVLTGPQPNPTDPILAAGLAEILNPATTNARRLELVQELLLFIRNRGDSK